MSYYTVRRDDSELRIVTCPKCKNADVIKTGLVVPYKAQGYLLRLMQCNQCQSYFSFYWEDGLKEITKEMAKEGLAKSRSDRQDNGKDCHGHSFYILFKKLPPNITQEEYDRLEGFEKDTNGNYIGKDLGFSKWKDALPPVNHLVRNKDILSAIDFDGMDYIKVEDNKWFK